MVYLCGAIGLGTDYDPVAMRSSPAIGHIRSAFLVISSPNKLNLLSWLLAYLCNK